MTSLARPAGAILKVESPSPAAPAAVAVVAAAAAAEERARAGKPQSEIHHPAGSSDRPSFLLPGPPVPNPDRCHPPPSALSTPPSPGEGGEFRKQRPRGNQQGHHLQRNMAGKGEITLGH